MRKLISVGFALSNNIWDASSSMLLSKVFFFAMEVKMPLISHDLLKERCSFLEMIWSIRIKIIIKTLTDSSLRVVTSPASGLRFFRLRLKSDIKVFGSKRFMHLNLALNFWWAGW